MPPVSVLEAIWTCTSGCGRAFSGEASEGGAETDEVHYTGNNSEVELSGSETLLKRTKGRDDEKETNR